MNKENKDRKPAKLEEGSLVLDEKNIIRVVRKCASCGKLVLTPSTSKSFGETHCQVCISSKKR